jgi:hypothetical protein
LIFPETIGSRSDLRHIPNDLARSAIFTVRNKREPRRTLTREKLFHYNEQVSLVYTGIELRADDDEKVWLQIVKYGESLPLGSPFKFNIKDLVADVGWQKNGRNYDRARESISRLKANEVLISNLKAYGKSGAVSMIQNYTTDNDVEGKATRYQVWIDPGLIVLFAGNTFTSHVWEVYRKLSPVARRLADYVASHQNPYPLALEKFRQMCGSADGNARSWRQTVKKACEEIKAAEIVTVALLEKDQICCCRPNVTAAPGAFPKMSLKNELSTDWQEKRDG